MKIIKFEPWTRLWKLVFTWERESRKVWNNTKSYWECKCDCWNIAWIPTSSLTKKEPTKSCWCLWIETVKKRNSTHWMRWTRIYSIYTGIRTRCYNPHEKTYRNYWARWIKCLWNSFEDFYRDMWESYEAHVKEYWEKDTTIERINVDWDYCKENCTWKTKKEQVNNLRTNVICEINWESKTLSEWVKILWIPKETLKRHLVKGKIKWKIYTRWTWETYKYKEFLWNWKS